MNFNILPPATLNSKFSLFHEAFRSKFYVHFFFMRLSYPHSPILLKHPYSEYCTKSNIYEVFYVCNFLQSMLHDNRNTYYLNVLNDTKTAALV